MAAERHRSTIEAINVPLLPEFVDADQRARFEALYAGLRHPTDQPTLRTALTDVGYMLGVKRPDWETVSSAQFDQARQLLTVLMQNTHFLPLIPEFLCGLGFEPALVIQETQPQPLNFLIISGRFGQDPLFSTLPNYLASKGRTVATLNVVGTYADEQRRFMGLPLLTRPVDHLIILAQTQSQRGGSFKTVRHVIRTLQNKPVAAQISRVDVMIPFWGGSRGHRLSQRKTMGYEVFETRASAAEITNTIHEVQSSLQGSKRGLNQIPQFTAYSIDIHNLEQPTNTLRRHRVEFVSLSPAPEFADAIYQQIEAKQLLGLPIKVVAPDKGAIPRTEDIVEHLLHHSQNHLKYIDIVYVDKFRTETGEVDPKKTKVAKVVRWSPGSGESIKKTVLPTPSPSNPDTQTCILLLSDDMNDGCGTGETDMNIAIQHYSRAQLKISAATHPVLSKGPQKLNRIGADVVILGNTLPTADLTHENGVKPEVLLVDLAPTLARALTE